MFWLKQIVHVVAMPLPFAMLVGATALLCRRLGRKGVSMCLLWTALTIAYLSSLQPVGNALLGPLERRFPTLTENANVRVEHVAVLGSGYTPRAGVPISGAIDPDGLGRLTEAVALMRVVGAKYLIVSGGGRDGNPSPAAGYAMLARSLGIEEESLIVLDRPLNTAAELREIVQLLGEAPFVLVTSAYHMPRAMRAAQLLGGRPIPAPAGHLANASLAAGGWRALLPGSGGLGKTERAVHEYLGLLALGAGLAE